MKKILYAFICGFMILSLTGCGENPKLATGEDVLVSFENEKLNISVEDLYNKLKKDYGINHLIEIIDAKILDSIYKNDEVAEKSVNNQIESMQIYYGGEQKFLETLQSYGYETVDEFKENLFLNYKRDLAVKDYIRDNIKDSDIKKYYDDEIFGDITASHILIKVNTDKSMTDDEKREVEEKVQETIDEIFKKLEEGADFHELAKEYSKDTVSAKNGGRLDAFNKGEMTEEFEKAAQKLEVGKYTTKAVLTEHGYHIIYKEAEKDKPKLDEIKDEIKDTLVDELIANTENIAVFALEWIREENDLKIYDSELKIKYDHYMNQQKSSSSN